jgi:hypothetical protein
MRWHYTGQALSEWCHMGRGPIGVSSFAFCSAFETPVRYRFIQCRIGTDSLQNTTIITEIVPYTTGKFDKCLQLLRAVLLSSSVTELQKPYPPGLEPRTNFCGSFRSCNLPAETNNPGLGAVLLSCLVSELKKPCLPVLEPRTFFILAGVVALVPVIYCPKQTLFNSLVFFTKLGGKHFPGKQLLITKTNLFNFSDTTYRNQSPCTK